MILDLYQNLQFRPRCVWSVAVVAIKPDGSPYARRGTVREHVTGGILITDVQTFVRRATLLRIRKRAQLAGEDKGREVGAWFRGVETPWEPVPAHARRVSLNPFKDDTFVFADGRGDDRKTCPTPSKVWITETGAFAVF